MHQHSKHDEPAFPADPEETGYQEMTMREWYAGMALLGILAGCQNLKAVPPLMPAECAEAAFKMADAILAEAAKPSPGKG